MSTQFSLPVRADEAAAPLLAGRQSVRPLSALLLYGSATLGLAVGLERVLGFLSNVLAARIAGPQTFGAYSLALATAGAIATYAGAGIGTTATRFSGQYRTATKGYRRFIVALAVVAMSSATLAALLMLVGAVPLGRWVLKNEGLIVFLRLSAASSAAIVLLDCCRGLLVGQQKYQAMLLLSVVSGVGLILVLPLAARISAGVMILGQGTVALCCVAAFLALAKRFGLWPDDDHDRDAGPGIGSVLTFGLVQFSAFAGITVASWWMASLVVRSDATLKQMGLYAIASQFRGLVALAPGLCAQVGYSLLTDESGSQYGGPKHVMLVNSFLASTLATMTATCGIVLAPWLLGLVYGRSFSGAEAAVVILLATAVVHMSGVPAAQRLNIVGLRLAGIISTIWAVLIAMLGIWLVPRAGAKGAALAFLASHTFSQLLVILALGRLGELAKGYLALFSTTTIGSALLGGLGYWRSYGPNRIALTIALAALSILMWVVLWHVGRRTRCLPEWKTIWVRLHQQRDVAHS